MSDSEGRCVHEMLPGQCGECQGRKTPYAHPEGPQSPFATASDVVERGYFGGDTPENLSHLRRFQGAKWFTATYDGECTRCGGLIVGGVDMIRSDEQGGWECCEA
jgi:hypothetical protein